MHCIEGPIDNSVPLFNCECEEALELVLLLSSGNLNEQKKGERKLVATSDD